MKKIIIVEDDPFLIKIMGRRLKEEGYEVEKATDGAQGLKMIKEGNYDIVLLDLIMPEKNGFQVLEGLKKAGISVGVLVFSNLSEPDDAEKALKLGAKAYFVKSDISIDEVVMAVKEFSRN